jgi:hypothetical protein
MASSPAIQSMISVVVSARVRTPDLKLAAQGGEDCDDFADLRSHFASLELDDEAQPNPARSRQLKLSSLHSSRTICPIVATSSISPSHSRREIRALSDFS